MYTVTHYPHGTFSWADTSSTNAAAAKQFYQQLFGWSHYDIPVGGGMTYTMFQHQGQHVAALSEATPEALEHNIPSHWSCYVAVDDVDALLPVITANGGTIIYGPMDVFDSGRMAFLADPTGAQLGLWQAKSHIGAGIVNTTGAMCWNELLTRDAARAKAFYSAVLGWEFYGDEHYTHISNRGRNNGGILQMDASFGDMPPCWMPYFHVADVDAGMARVAELGGRVVTPKMQAGEDAGNWFTVVEDPAGAHFYIMQLEKADPWLE